ncbi:MAG TPA: PEGA domain-containing protein [Thermodesulfobacteriota bacterium]|nr:PEGA domain-containing protein [Thermodesulfobacteriota bacterium]
MMKHGIKIALVMFAACSLFCCSGKNLELKVKARLDGESMSQARVTVDNEEQGFTGPDGIFSKIIKRKPGVEVEIVVSKEMTGYRIQPWKAKFVMKLPKSDTVDVYAFDADLVATRYVTVTATEKGAPVADAIVRAAGKEVGKTDAQGMFVYEYKTLPKSGADLTVTKSGYATWRKTGKLEPGEKLVASLSKRVVVTISALMEEYGQSSGIPGIAVNINDKEVGKTDAKGALIYTHDGETGKKVSLTLSAPGYIPETWKTSVVLGGEISIQRYFYPTTPRPIRAGIYRFVSNTPSVDLKEVLSQTETSMAAQLFKSPCFREVPSQTLQTEIRQAKLSIEKITAKGWVDTPLRKTVDMIIVGSVAKDEKGFLIETKFYASGGKLILSQIVRAKGAGDLNSAAKETANAVLERFPFEGTIVSAEGERYRINLGKSGYRITKGMDFTLLAPRFAETGKVSGYRETGRLRVKKAEESASWTEVEDLKKDEKITVGDRVVRRIYHEGEEEASRNTFILSAKGGLPPDVSPLGAVNIYVNDEWLGSTGADGKAEVPVRLNKSFTLMLYRHGYQQVTEKLKIEKSKDIREFVLAVNNAIFKVDSEPSSAGVFVDGDKIGQTPILDGKPVTLGFHTVKVTAGGDFRDWEEVVEFSKKEEDRTGDRKIVLAKDFLKIGQRAREKGDIEGAIQAYKSTEKGHPDYSEAHHRLAQIYLDEKGDYDAATREFENVLSLPENQQLIYKQFSVAFMNLGHAYYEKGNVLVQKDQEAAAQNFAKAIQNLQIAKQNTRFFPNVHYDEAVHDTYYYTALSYHKLYLITRKNNLLNNANLAWREYFDFFPRKLEGNGAFEKTKEGAQKYWDQIKNL